MKSILLIPALALITASALAADAKTDVINAAKKLGEKGNYSWKQTVDMGANSQFRMGPTEGKTANGTVLLTMTRGENTVESALKGDKGAIKTEEGWKSIAELSEGDSNQRGPGRFTARMLQSFRAPADQAADLAQKVKELKKEGDVVQGDLTEEGAKELMAFRRPGATGGQGPTVTGAKGSAKFWIKDGVLAKYEYKLQGSMNFNNNDIDVDRTTTVEIKDVGTTKVDLPEEAKKKLS